jgi:hypothetical protein
MKKTKRIDNIGYVKLNSGTSTHLLSAKTSASPRFSTYFFLSLLVAAFCALGVFTLSGCAQKQTDEEVIREQLTTELDSIKNVDSNFVDDFSESINMTQLSVYGIDGTDFMQAYLNGFDYSIDDISVEGDQATATVTLTCKSYSGYQNALEDAVTKITENPEELTTMTEDDINKKIGEIVIGSLENVDLAQTTPIEIKYTKENDTWEPASSTSGDIASALMTN